jgi:hypothetical protein
LDGTAYWQSIGRFESKKKFEKELEEYGKEVGGIRPVNGKPKK